MSILFMQWFFGALERLENEEKGQTAIEYGLVLALIAVGIAVAMKAGLAGVAGDVATKVKNAITVAT